MTWQSKLFSFRGRITRLDYWLYTIAILVALAIALYGAIALTGAAVVERANTLLVTFGLCILVFVWPLSALGVKRCHDREKSAWWYVGWLIGGRIPLVGILISIWSLVELGFLDGTQGPNAYGPSPKGISNTQVSDVFS